MLRGQQFAEALSLDSKAPTEPRLKLPLRRVLQHLPELFECSVEILNCQIELPEGEGQRWKVSVLLRGEEISLRLEVLSLGEIDLGGRDSRPRIARLDRQCRLRRPPCEGYPSTSEVDQRNLSLQIDVLRRIVSRFTQSPHLVEQLFIPRIISLCQPRQRQPLVRWQVARFDRQLRVVKRDRVCIGTAGTVEIGQLVEGPLIFLIESDHVLIFIDCVIESQPKPVGLCQSSVQFRVFTLQPGRDFEGPDRVDRGLDRHVIIPDRPQTSGISRKAFFKHSCQLDRLEPVSAHRGRLWNSDHRVDKETITDTYRKIADCPPKIGDRPLDVVVAELLLCQLRPARDRRFTRRLHLLFRCSCHQILFQRRNPCRWIFHRQHGCQLLRNRQRLGQNLCAHSGHQEQHHPHYKKLLDHPVALFIFTLRPAARFVLHSKVKVIRSLLTCSVRHSWFTAAFSGASGPPRESLTLMLTENSG